MFEMAHCKLPPQEFIQNTFSPMVAVLTTTAVENISSKNNLSFLQMIRPFCKLNAEAHFRDPSGVEIPVKNFRVNFCDVYWRPPQPSEARINFNESVSSYLSERTTTSLVGGVKLEIPVSVPWYEAWRHTFLQVQFPSDHEFTKHYIGYLLVISTTDSSPLESLVELVDRVQSLMSDAPNKLPKWFGPSPLILCTFLLIHDNSTGDSNIGKATFEAMKTTYGDNRCFFLSINSQTPNSTNAVQLPDPWAQFISSHIQATEKTKDEEMSQGIETAQEAGEKAAGISTPSILHPLSPVAADCSFTPNGYILPEENEQTNVLHGLCLTAEDINKIRHFVTEFCLKALIPHFEQQINLLNDQVSNKKGVSRSLFSATKRWFGTSKPGTPGNNIPPTSITYSVNSHELQLRRLGDLCFMIGHYSLAFTAYHSAKRDFGADGAWLHYAGALEMAALSAFMSNNESISKKVIDYAEESITTYLNSCRMQQFATRATILSVECLKGKGLYGEAANQLIRMTSEDSDLRSAVLLEQAAYCFLHSQRPTMHRKYSFHMVFAGHRYSKAGHKHHSIRCYSQAYQVYENKCWSVAEDHINFTVGKQSSQLKLATNAVEAFSRLVTRSSRQSATQQQLFLKEYITTVQQLESDFGELKILAIPVIEYFSIQVLLGHPSSRGLSPNIINATGINFDNPNDHQNRSLDEGRWGKLEEKLVTFVQGMNTMVFKPTVELFTNKTNNSSSPVVVLGELVSLNIGLKNPLHIPIKLHNLHLSWSVIPEEGGMCQDNSQGSKAAVTDPISEITIEPESTRYVVLTIMPAQVGELLVTGISYKLVDTSSGLQVSGRQPLIIIPSQSRRKDDIAVIDKRLHFVVVGKAPYLQVSFSGLKDDLICGEVMTVEVQLKNTGLVPISRILLASTGAYSLWVEGQTESNNESDSYTVAEIPVKEPLNNNESMSTTLFIRVPKKESETTLYLDMLFLYEGTEQNPKIRYRLIRHSWPALVHNFVQISSLCTRSNSTIIKDDVLNMRLEVFNESKENGPFQFSVFMGCVSLYSDHWRLAKQIFVPEDLKIGMQESLFLMLQAQRCNFEVGEKMNTFTSIKLQSDHNYLPYKCFIPNLISSDDNPELNIICIINWVGEIQYRNGGTRKVCGQDHLIITNINKTIPSTINPTPLKIFGQSQQDSVELLDRLVSYRIHHPQIINHGFTRERLCIVPVELLLQNCTCLSISIKVEAVTSPNSASDNSTVPLCFAWTGQTVFFKDLKAYANVNIQLSAAITAPGTYDLSSRLSVMARTFQNFKTQIYKPEAVVVVS